MAKRVKGVQVVRFGGLDSSVSPTRMPNDKTQVQVNTCLSRGGLLLPRKGYSRTNLAKTALPPRAVIWFVDRGGVDKFMYEQTGSGLVYGLSLPTPRWNREPIIRPRGGGGGTPPFGEAFSPVTDLTITNLRTMTLTWTNPTSAYWVATKILRRSDGYPTGPNDAMATELQNNRLSTVSDSALAVGSTGYYAAYAYSATKWALPDTTSGTKEATPDTAIFVGTSNGTGYLFSVTGATVQTVTQGAGFIGVAGVLGGNLYGIEIDGSDNVNVYRSTNGGTTWASVASISQGRYFANESFPTISPDGGYIVAAEVTAGPTVDAGYWYSVDDGVTWTFNSVSGTDSMYGIIDTIPTTNVEFLSNNINVYTCAQIGGGNLIPGAGYVLEQVYSTTSYILCAFSDTATATIYYATSGGGSITASSASISAAPGDEVHIAGIAASGDNAVCAFITSGSTAPGLRVFYSSDGGVNWTESGSSPLTGEDTTAPYESRSSNRMMYFDGKLWYAGKYLWVSTDVGVTWAKANTTEMTDVIGITGA